MSLNGSHKAIKFEKDQNEGIVEGGSLSDEMSRKRNETESEVKETERGGHEENEKMSDREGGGGDLEPILKQTNGFHDQ